MGRVLILSNSSAGLYRFRKELMTALLADNEVFASLPDEDYAEEISALGVSFVKTQFNRNGLNPLRELALTRRYRTMIRDIKPDAVLTYTSKPNIYGNIAARRQKIPVISTVTGLGNRFKSKRPISVIMKLLYRHAFSKTACVAFQNKEDSEIMREVGILKNQRTLFVPGSGVNLQQYEVLEYPDEPVVSFLFMGRIKPTKGLRELAEATRRLKSKPQTPDFCVKIMGRDLGELSIEEMTKDGFVEYIGYQKDVVPHIRAAHCIMMPSYSEGTSNVLLEGAASGRPLIATNISGCREIIDDGINGFLCQPRDVDSLYDCMERFLMLTHDQRVEMGLASRRKVEEVFSREIVVSAMVREIEIHTH